MFTLHNGDCLEYLATLPVGSVSCVVTDPPYIGYEYDWEYVDMMKFPQWILDLRWFCFWSGSEFPLTFTARHIWSKANRNIGKNAEQYEEIYERNGSATGLVYRHAVIDSVMNAQLNRDEFFNHPTQKPITLIKKLVEKISRPGDVILDPFMGSGTTGAAALKLGRSFIGCENKVEYFHMAESRVQSTVLSPSFYTLPSTRLHLDVVESPVLPGLSKQGGTDDK
jgi:DNA modification methylase